MQGECRKKEEGLKGEGSVGEEKRGMEKLAAVFRE